ncbi:MAG: FAD-dependent oxidoreductase [Spirochaetes bacterium]|nr:FAD-dependent oxidoreductase [Spirochaetota bacterium]
MSRKKIKTVIKKKYDVVVVGGGMSGVCASLASARHGARTALIQNRPVLGGNASSEIRMHICGADHHGSRPDARETGIIEEILLENRKRNPQHSFSVFDTILWEKVHFQKDLDLYLNTHFTDVVVEENIIKRIVATQITTETIYELEGTILVDATGDGTLSFFSGAETMTGREGKEIFGERHAPDKSDSYTMGNTLLFRAADMGTPIPFERPSWARIYSEEDLSYRSHQEITSGYWWIELGGMDNDVITDSEEIRDELLKAVYGIWDHIKNSGHHQAENYALEWVGFLPGKRESRRIVGDYILREQDIVSGSIFEDAVAYGGWPMDIHVPGGLRSQEKPYDSIKLPGLYTIPYRSLYARDISNLLMAGRIISASHIALSSSRVMATCSVIGQAVGTAAAIAAQMSIFPRDVPVDELQKRLMKDDCYLPGYRNEDEDDLARIAAITCSSAVPGGEGQNVINGFPRRIKKNKNCWISEPIREQGEWISLDFNHTITPNEIDLRFDSNLSGEIMISLSQSILEKQIPGIPPELVRDYTIECFNKEKIVYKEDTKANYLRHRIHSLPDKIACDRVKIRVHSTNGDKRARIFEVRIY